MSTSTAAAGRGSDSRIVYLSQLFDPEPTFKGLDFIKGLESEGFKVEVVTGFPNYPGGKVYDGFRIRPLTRERLDGTEVTRLAMYPSHDRSALRRIACYASFMVTSFLYLTFRAKRSDLVYVYYPSLTAGLAAVAAKLFRRTPVIIDIQDMWPDSLGSSGMMNNRVVMYFANLACNLLYRTCDHIVVLSPGFKALLVERGVPADKITIVYNWADETPPLANSGPPSAFDPSDGFRVLFAGNMGAAQELDIVLDAAARLKDERPDCTFYFMGGGIDKDRLAQRAGEMGLSNVRFLPRVPLQEVQAYLNSADVLLVHLRDEPLFRITIPSKTQAYLFAGRPILMGVGGDAADLVQSAEAGVVFASGDAAQLAEAIRGLHALGRDEREAMGRRGREFYEARLSRSVGVGAISALINRFKRRSSRLNRIPGDSI